MKLYRLSNTMGDMIQYMAHYNNEYMLCIDFMDGELDTYNVLNIDDFEGIDYKSYLVDDFEKDIQILFLKFLFTLGFDGGDESSIR